MDEGSRVDHTAIDSEDREMPNWQRIPDMEQVVNELLPTIMATARRYRRPGGDVPADWWSE
jgi:hypothetical protein